MTKKINLGSIGLGYVGKFHLRNCLRLESANLIAVADLSKKALKLAKRLGVKQTFTDYHQLLKQPTVDAVIIALPTHLHASCAISVAEQGKHVFLEKPIARNPEEGKKILSAVRKNNVKLMVGYPSRFKSSYLDLKKKLESGVLGDIQTAHAVNIAAGPFFHRGIGIPRPVPEWWFKKELTGGGALMDLGSHMINLTRWYFGEINNIKAYLGYRFNFDFEDHAICIANFTSGTTAIINVGWFSQKAAVGIELFGTVAHASSYHSSPSKVITAIQLLLGKTPKFFIPYLKEVSHFVRCIKEDTQPSPSGEEAIKDLEAIKQAYENQINLSE
jgi:UDP-N-acetylglucosamine 3-dehydrogenase